MTELQKIYHEAGFAIPDQTLPADLVGRFCELSDAVRQCSNIENVSNSSGTYGLRNLVDVMPQIAELVRHDLMQEVVGDVLGDGAFMVRSTLFDKTAGANWGVFWHQDRSIAVQEKHEVEGFSGWTGKAGVTCVRPPGSLMNRILALRIHLDDCRASNGALRVLPGTHHETLSPARIENHQAEVSAVTCEVPAGGLLLMNPMLLHASSPMDNDKTAAATSRRVIHLEFAAFELPHPLQWRYRVPCSN